MNTRFPGQWFQLESGLHYNWHRHYDPTLGRYTQPDPLGFVDGPSVYAYATSSPLQRIDKHGLLSGGRSKPKPPTLQCKADDQCSEGYDACYNKEYNTCVAGYGTWCALCLILPDAKMLGKYSTWTRPICVAVVCGMGVLGCGAEAKYTCEEKCGAQSE